jgi:hypothetical protein
VEDFEAEEARLLLGVGEGGVGETGEPVVVVVGGVVDAVGTVGTDVGGGNAGVLKEGRVVGAGAEFADVGGVFGRSVGIGWGNVVVGLVVLLPLVVDGGASRGRNFFLTSRMKVRREGTAAALKDGPETATSMLK